MPKESSDRESEYVCVCERERDVICVCVWERESEWERERERERDVICLCVCVWVSESGCVKEKEKEKSILFFLGTVVLFPIGRSPLARANQKCGKKSLLRNLRRKVEEERRLNSLRQKILTRKQSYKGNLVLLCSHPHRCLFYHRFLTCFSRFSKSFCT